MLVISKHLLIVLVAALMSVAASADCGTPPDMPDLPKGAKASMDELVSASKAVKSYIATVDTYLDCREAEMATDAFKAQDKKVLKAAKQELVQLIKQRNSIGDDFNREVSAYKKANPG